MQLLDFIVTMDIVFYSIVLSGTSLFATLHYFYLVFRINDDRMIDVVFKFKCFYLNLISALSFASLVSLLDSAYAYFTFGDVEQALFIFFDIPLISLTLNVAFQLWDLIFLDDDDE